MNPRDRPLPAGKSNLVEAVAQRAAEPVIDLIVNTLDVNALLARVDLDAVLGSIDIAGVLQRVDLNAVLARVDVNALLDRVDVNALLARANIDEVVGRIDMDALVRETDLGAVIARSSGGLASEALDAARSQAAGLDQFIDRWVRRLLRRTSPGPSAPGAVT